MGTESFIGIDFGTAYTSIVNVTKDGGREKISVLGEDGENPFAALLAITSDNKVFFGNRVKKTSEALCETAKLVSPLAEMIGTDKSIVINGKECPPRQMAAEYFRCLKRVIMKKYGVNVTEAVIAFPSSFSHEARLDILAAAKKAEIDVKGFIPEHYAAYLSMRKSLEGRSSVMIADWGGRTLDIYILANNGGKIRVKAAFSENVGGKDIDLRLAQRLHTMLGELAEDKSRVVPFEMMPAADRDKLINVSETVKIRISAEGGEIPVTVADYGNYGTRTVTLTESAFAEIVKPIVREHVMTAINTAMSSVKMRAADIGAVLAAGGSSGLRAFAGVLKSIFGEEKVIFPEKPQIVSARGAALSQTEGGTFRLSEDIGVLMSDDNVFPLLKKDSPAEGLKSGVFPFAVVDDSTKAQVIVTDGSGKLQGSLDFPVGGFLNERLEISARVDETLMPSVSIHRNSDADPMNDAGMVLFDSWLYYDLG